MAETRPTVFISSTSRDLAAHRAAVVNAILSLDMRPINITEFGSQDKDAVETVLSQVRRANYFIGIIAHRYGYIPDGMTKSVTEQEYDEAVRLKLPILMFLVDPDFAWPEALIERNQATEPAQKLALFKERLGQQHVYDRFTTPEDLASKVTASLARLERTSPPSENKTLLQRATSLFRSLTGLEQQQTPVVKSTPAEKPPEAEPAPATSSSTQSSEPNKLERFTQRARHVLGLAQEEVERLNHAEIGPEHILLGLLREEGGIAGRVLREIKVDFRQAEEQLLRLTKVGKRQPGAKIELSAGAKKLLELAVDEARRMGHHYIGTEHLLLGLARQQESVAVDILRRQGVTPEEIRRQTRRALQESPLQSTVPLTGSSSAQSTGLPKMERFTQRARRVITLAQEEAERLDHAEVGVEHGLLGLMREEGGVAGRVLREFKIDPRQIEVHLLRLTKIAKRQPDVNIELTAGTKRWLELAVDEARRMGHHYIGTEHMLLGLVRQQESVAVDILRILGVTPEEIRGRTRRVLQESPTESASPSGAGPLPQPAEPKRKERFTKPARHVIEMAQDEAERLNHAEIGVEHLLLGLMREEDGGAAQVLREFKIDRGQTEEQLLRLTRIGKHQLDLKRGLTTDYSKGLDLAADEAHRLGHPYISTEHILLGLTRQQESAVVDIFHALGAAPEEIGGHAGRRLLENPSEETMVSDLKLLLETDLLQSGTVILQSAIPNRAGRTTQRTRRVIGRALQEAKRLDHTEITPGHILLAQLGEEGGVAARVLQDLGVNPFQVEAHLIRLTKDEKVSSGSKPELTPDSKKTLELAIGEVALLGHHYIGVEHLLLGIASQQDSVAVEILGLLGVSPEQIQKQTLRVLQDGPIGSGPDSSQLSSLNRLERFTQRARRALLFAHEEAERLAHTEIGAEHILLGLMREEGGLAARILRELGIELSRIEEPLLRLTKMSKRQLNTSIQLSTDSSSILDLAFAEVERMEHRYIGTEHLLLGLVSQPDSVAVGILRDLQVDPEDIRRQTYRILQVNPIQSPVDVAAPPQAATHILHLGLAARRARWTTRQIEPIILILSSEPDAAGRLKAVALPADAHEITVMVTSQMINLRTQCRFTVQRGETARHMLEADALLPGTGFVQADVFADGSLIDSHRLMIDLVIDPKIEQVTTWPALPAPRDAADPRAYPPDMTIHLQAVPLTHDGQRLRVYGTAYTPMEYLQLNEQQLGYRDVSRRVIEGISARYTALGTHLHTSRHARAEIVRLGRMMWQFVLPPEMGKVYGRMIDSRTRIRSLLFLTDRSLDLPLDLAVAPNSDQTLSEQFEVARWIEGLGQARRAAFAFMPERIAQIHEAAVQKELPHYRLNAVVELETELSAALAPDHPALSMHLTWAGGHLRGQAKALVPVKDENDWAEYIRRQGRWMQAKAPFIGISLLRDSRSSTMTSASLYQLFLENGASAVVGARWGVTPAVDSAFWQTFYHALSHSSESAMYGLRLGEALVAARNAVRMVSSHPLDQLAFYALGDPMAAAYPLIEGVGYLRVECLEQAGSGTVALEVGQTYRFRATLKRHVPFEYEKRLCRLQPWHRRPSTLHVHAMGCDVPQGPLEPIATYEDEYAWEFSLTPRQKGRTALFIDCLDDTQTLFAETLTKPLTIAEGKPIPVVDVSPLHTPLPEDQMAYALILNEDHYCVDRESYPYGDERPDDEALAILSREIVHDMAHHPHQHLDHLNHYVERLLPQSWWRHLPSRTHLTLIDQHMRLPWEMARIETRYWGMDFAIGHLQALPTDHVDDIPLQRVTMLGHQGTVYAKLADAVKPYLDVIDGEGKLPPSQFKDDDLARICDVYKRTRPRGQAAHLLHLVMTVEADKSYMMPAIVLHLANGNLMRLPIIQNLASIKPMLNNALVVLSPIKTGAQHAIDVTPFAYQLLTAGAIAVVTPFCSLTEDNGYILSQQFYQQLRDHAHHETLGQIVRRVRENCFAGDHQQHLYGLSYLLFGDPHLRVRLAL